jgi:hypothetical protein
MLLRKSAVIGLAAIGLSAGLAHSAKADVLPVTNLDFNVFSGTFTPPKDFFTHANPTGWSIGAAAQIDNLIYVGQQGSEGFLVLAQVIYMVFILTLDSRIPFPPAPTSFRQTAIPSSRARSFRPFPG